MRHWIRLVNWNSPAAIDFLDSHPFESYQYGSLRYDEPRPETPDRVVFHIGNPIAPRSIEEWQRALGLEDRIVLWHYGFWGQFISARGDLNVKDSAVLRTTGLFPYWPRASHGSFDAMPTHLARLA